MSVELVRYEAARTALMEAKRFDEVKDIRDRAVALEVYAKQAHDPRLIYDATEIRMRAERRAGEMLREMRDKGQRAKSSTQGTLTRLADLGIDKRESHRWQRLSEMAQEEYDKLVAEAQQQAFHAVASTPQERTEEKRERRAQHETEKIRNLSVKRFGVILADPEWRFVPWSEETGTTPNATALADIKKRDVPSIADDDCVLALWATVPMLPQALEVMKAWGFDYRSHVVWLKNKVGTGYWFRNSHELLLIGVKGDVPAPAPGTQWESAFDADVGEHSEKPVEVYHLLEAYFPHLPRIELNARKPARPGWEVWGADAPVEMEAGEPS